MNKYKNIWLAFVGMGVFGCTSQEEKKSGTGVSDPMVSVPPAAKTDSVFRDTKPPVVVEDRIDLSEPERPRARDNTRRPVETPDPYQPFEPIYKTPELFTIDPGRDTTLIGLEGTQITIKARAFVDLASGKEVTEPVLVSLEEYYKRSDMVKANLTTTSGAQLLETGGMLHLSATRNGQKLVLKKELPLEIKFSGAGSEKEGMQLFSGKAGENHSVDWKPVHDTLDARPAKFLRKANPFPSKNGYEEIADFLSRNLGYRALSHEHIREKAIVSFRVTKNGEVQDIRLTGDSRYRKILKTMTQVFKNSSAWKPGMYGQRPVDTQVTLWMKVKKNWKGRLVFDAEYRKGQRFHEPYYTLPVKYLEAPLPSDSVLPARGNGRSAPYNPHQETYGFSTIHLGWINCDRFLERKDLVVLRVSTDQTVGASVVLVLKNINSILPGTKVRNGFQFKVPKNEEVVIVSMAYQDGKPCIAMLETKAVNEMVRNLVYQPADDKSVKEALGQLDK
jgi:hypothetical protein